MPMMDGAVARLNGMFSPAGIGGTAGAASSFAPGRRLDAGFAYDRGTPEHEQLQAYLDIMPAAMRETIRANVYHALTQSPPVPMTFAWTAAYDFAVSVSQYPNTAEREGSITIALQGPYPSDPYMARRFYDQAQMIASASRKSGAAKRSGDGAKRAKKSKRRR